MKLEVLNINGEKTGRSLELPEEVFGITPNEHVVYLAVKQYLAAQRQGTHAVKNRSEVKGSSRKLHKQKGTGGSRKGNIRNPLYKGGGVIFGPQPHLYVLKLNKKTKDLAKCSVLSDKFRSGAVLAVEDVERTAPKTKDLVQLFKRLSIEGKKVLYVLNEDTSFRYNVLSLRNIPGVFSATVNSLNVYNVLHADVVLFSEAAARIFEDVSEEAKVLVEE